MHVDEGGFTSNHLVGHEHPCIANFTSFSLLAFPVAKQMVVGTFTALDAPPSAILLRDLLPDALRCLKSALDPLNGHRTGCAHGVSGAEAPMQARSCSSRPRPDFNIKGCREKANASA